MTTYIALIIGGVFFLLLLLRRNSKVGKGKTRTYSDTSKELENSTTSTDAKFSTNEYPDRSDNIIMLQGFIEKAIEKGDLETANLNFAKLIESMRQQNENFGKSLTPVLKDSMRLYSEFRSRHGLAYPSQFAQNIEGELGSHVVEEYSELLKSATKISSTDINKAIELVREALEKESNEFQIHKKLTGYMQKAGRFKEAEEHLWNCYSEFDDFHRGQILDYLAVLHKKEKNDSKAIELDSYGMWYTTMFNSPLGYSSVDAFFDSIVLGRKYKNKHSIELLNVKMREFWGKEWLKKYLEDFNKSFKTSRGLQDQNNVFLSEIKKLNVNKSFDSYKQYLKELK